MLKITAIGNLTHDVELKMNETTGKPYAILRIASDRRYRDRDGNKLTDFISIKVRGPLAERCAQFAWKGCKLAAAGDFETIAFTDEPERQPGFLIKARSVEFLSPRRAEAAALAVDQTATQRSGCGLERRSSEMNELSRLRGSERYEACDDDAA